MKKQLITTAVIATLTLSACGLTGGSDGAASDSGDSGGGGAMNIDTAGPTVCIDAALKHLGPDAMVNEIESYFQVSSEIDPPLIETDSTPPAGDLNICKAYYQDPSDPVKLLGIDMDTSSGEFGEPEPVEISVFGDAADFNLNDYLIKASDIDTSIVQPKLDEKTAALDTKYSLWQWSRLSLVAPGSDTDVHAFEAGMDGRLASNDISEQGFFLFTLDGTIVNDTIDS